MGSVAQGALQPLSLQGRETPAEEKAPAIRLFKGGTYLPPGENMQDGAGIVANFEVMTKSFKAAINGQGVKV